MNSFGSKLQWNIQVLGTVQGVCLRYMIKKKAHSLQVDGFVQNCEDGSVVASLQGTARQLEALELWLRSNPGDAVIRKISKQLVKTESFDDFQIRY